MPLLCRWTVIALAIALCCFAPRFTAALQPALPSDSTAHDSASVTVSDSTHFPARGAFTTFGFWVYGGMSKAYRWVSRQLQPVARAFSHLLKQVFGEHYDENSILRVPLSRRS